MRPSANLDGRTRTLLITFLLALAALSIHRLHCAPAPVSVVELGGATMGTTWSVKLAPRPDLDPATQRVLGERIRETLEEVEARMSTYRADSELSRFNRHPAGSPYPASESLREVLRLSREISERSGGAFDVTVSPLVAIWGFGAEGAETPEEPAPEALERAREAVDYRALELDDEAQTLLKRRPGVTADLSAIAKGYGVDRVVELLKSLGYTDLLVEVGGELRAMGRKSEDSPWRVAIERPESHARRIHQVIALEDAALATSGDYRNYYERDGMRISHTIDPRDGRPISHALASVSVVHPEAASADAWATALNVLGPVEGFALAEREELAALFIVREAEGVFESRATRSFPQTLAVGEAP